MPTKRQLQTTAAEQARTINRLHGAAISQEAELHVTTERLAAVEFAMEDVGWSQLGAEGSKMSRSQLADVIERSRVFAVKHPLVKRGVRMRSEYVFGQGYQLVAQDPALQDQLEQLVDHGKNMAVLFGHQATLERARQLDTDGSVFIALIPNTFTGDVHLRAVPVDQITEIISDPNDAQSPWFYKRQYTYIELTATGRRTVTRTQLHPAASYAPTAKAPMLDKVPVMWEQPMVHARTDSQAATGFGIPDTYAALPWATAYKRFLEDFASMARALSQYAFKVQAPKGGAAATKAKLGTSRGPASTAADTNPRPTSGATWVQEGDLNLSPISKSGATLDVDSGKPLRLMIGAALDLPDTIMTGDADQGSLATAHSLDRPTELAMGSRQQLWGQLMVEVARYAEATAVRAGVLPGRYVVRPDGSWYLEGRPESNGVEVLFPPLVEHQLADLVTALQALAGTEGADQATVLRLLYQALGVRNVEDLIDAAALGVVPDEGAAIETAIEALLVALDAN